jgi:hypothetical protein
MSRIIGLAIINPNKAVRVPDTGKAGLTLGHAIEDASSTRGVGKRDSAATIVNGERTHFAVGRLANVVRDFDNDFFLVGQRRKALGDEVQSDVVVFRRAAMTVDKRIEGNVMSSLLSSMICRSSVRPLRSSEALIGC